MTARKMKISVSLAADLVGAVDRTAANEGATRSAVMERWLRTVTGRERLARLQEETAAYYDGLSTAERQDDAEWAAAASRAGRKLSIDEVPIAPRQPRRRRRG